MNFQKLRINSNNIDWKKGLDFSIENLEKDAEDYKVDSFSNKAHCSEDMNYSIFDNNKIFDIKNFDNNIMISHNQCSPKFDNSLNNQLLSYGKHISSLFNISNNFLLQKKRGKNIKNRKNSSFTGKSLTKHTKYSIDNMQRRCKSLILNYTLEYLNYQIKKIYNGNIGNGIYIRKLFDINQEQKANNSVDYVRNFMNKTVKEIFSAHISKRYTSFLPNHNQIVINRALNEKDETKREKFEKLFNLTFVDCLQKFLGKDNSEDSEGFTLFSHIKYKLHDDKEYLDRLEKFLNEFIDKINSRKPKYSNKCKIKEKVKHQ
jgi:hypothetical protein